MRFQSDSRGVDWQELIQLVADGDAAPFYARLGFEPFGHVMARLDQSRLYEPP